MDHVYLDHATAPPPLLPPRGGAAPSPTDLVLLSDQSHALTRSEPARYSGLLDPEREAAHLRYFRAKQLRELWRFVWDRYICSSLPLRAFDGASVESTPAQVEDASARLDALQDYILKQMGDLGGGGTELQHRIDRLQGELAALSERLSSIGKKRAYIFARRKPLSASEWRKYRTRIASRFEKADVFFEKMIREAFHEAFPRSLKERIFGSSPQSADTHTLPSEAARRIERMAQQALIGVGLQYATSTTA